MAPRRVFVLRVARNLAIALTPVAHRLLHRFHREDRR
jgi:hypothetical protein